MRNLKNTGTIPTDRLWDSVNKFQSKSQIAAVARNQTLGYSVPTADEPDLLRLSRLYAARVAIREELQKD